MGCLAQRGRREQHKSVHNYESLTNLQYLQSNLTQAYPTWETRKWGILLDMLLEVQTSAEGTERTRSKPLCRAAE
jgi:hypothetical protein